MESIRFADILFTVIVLAVTFGILYLVGLGKKKAETDGGGTPESGDQSQSGGNAPS